MLFAIIEIPRIGKIAVETEYAPFIADVYLNDKKVSNNAVNYLEPGEYNLVVRLDHFEELIDTVYIHEDTELIYGSLTPIDEEGERIVSDNINDFYEIEGIVGEILSDEGIKQKEANPILNYLPLKNSLYSIGSTYSESDDFIVTITAIDGYTDMAIDAFYNLSPEINPINYNVRINSLENPLNNVFINNTSVSPYEFIQTGFSSILSEYIVLQEGTRDGDYYFTTIRVYVYQDIEANYTSFRIVLKSTPQGWQLAATPQPILTKHNTSGIPDYILDAVNQIYEY